MTQAEVGLGQETADYQAHSGTVNTSTTPVVQYGYNLMSGGANNSRPTSMTYPNGKVLTLNYNTGSQSTLDNSLSRLSSISDSGGTLEALTYLGLSTVVQQVEGPIQLTYIGSGTGDAGDKYTGLDRFGRIVEQLWQTSGMSPTTTDDFLYGYDQDNNALYKLNNVNTAFSELYHANGSSNGYDNLNRIVSWSQGTLNSSHDTISSPTNSESYALDAVGNFTSVVTNGTTVTESANKQNEVTSVSGSTTPVYDHNGNMTTDQNGNTLTYDAWNRLIQVKNSGGTTLITYSYDGLGRRITENRSGTTTDLYYLTAGQVVEERVGGTAKYQYVWSPTYVNALVLRDQLNSDGSLNQRLWVQQDANYNVTAITDNGGSVVERYTNDPYGVVTVLTASWGSRSSSSYGWVYTFQGGRSEPLTGLVRFGIRDDNVALRVWMEPDPKGFGAGQVSFYGFVKDNPTNNTDPTGLFQFFGQTYVAPWDSSASWDLSTSLFGQVALAGTVPVAVAGAAVKSAAASASQTVLVVGTVQAVKTSEFLGFPLTPEGIARQKKAEEEYRRKQNEFRANNNPYTNPSSIFTKDYLDYGYLSPFAIPTSSGESIARDMMMLSATIYPEVHGNSLSNASPHHTYEIFETETGDVVKNGISGRPLNKNGTSPRANQQVNRFNRAEGTNKYDARITGEDIPGRIEARDIEAAQAQALRQAGNSMSKHKRP